MKLQKSDLQLENIVFKKAQELNVFYPFLFQSLLYMALNKKEQYTAADTDKVLFEAYKTVYEVKKREAPDQDFFAMATQALFLIKQEHLIFSMKFGGGSFFDFVRLLCEKELQAFDDYFAMGTSGFSEEDIQTVMEGYV